MITSIPTWPIPIRARKPRRNWRDCATSRCSRYAAGARGTRGRRRAPSGHPAAAVGSQPAHGCRRGPSPPSRPGGPQARHCPITVTRHSHAPTLSLSPCTQPHKVKVFFVLYSMFAYLTMHAGECRDPGVSARAGGAAAGTGRLPRCPCHVPRRDSKYHLVATPAVS